MLKNYDGFNFIINVGEPWDFKSSEGEGILRGVITNSVLINDKMVFICSCSYFNYNDKLINQIILTRRYAEDMDLLSDETMNCFFSTRSEKITKENVSNFLLNNPNKSFLVGGVHLLN